MKKTFIMTLAICLFGASMAQAKNIECELLEYKYTKSSDAADLFGALNSTPITITLINKGEDKGIGSATAGGMIVDLTEDTYLKGLYQLMFQVDAPRGTPTSASFQTLLKKDQKISESDLNEDFSTILKLKKNEVAQGYAVLTKSGNPDSMMIVSQKVRDIVTNYNKSVHGSQRIGIHSDATSSVLLRYWIMSDEVKDLLSKSNLAEGETIAAGLNTLCLERK